jgi:hypothetical protein
VAWVKIPGEESSCEVTILWTKYEAGTKENLGTWWYQVKESESGKESLVKESVLHHTEPK